MAQVVGVALALAGLFYTVIPLYQKAAVDEQLARREAELKGVEAALADAKSETYRLRRDNYVRVATSTAADECSDVRRGFMPIPDHNIRSVAEYRLRLDVNVRDCIARYMATAAKVKEVNEADLAVWTAWAAAIGGELEARRQDALPVFGSSQRGPQESDSARSGKRLFAPLMGVPASPRRVP